MKNYKMENTTRPTETEYYPLENIDKQINGKRFINIILGVFFELFICLEKCNIKNDLQTTVIPIALENIIFLF